MKPKQELLTDVERNKELFEYEMTQVKAMLKDAFTAADPSIMKGVAEKYEDESVLAVALDIPEFDTQPVSVCAVVPNTEFERFEGGVPSSGAVTYQLEHHVDGLDIDLPQELGYAFALQHFSLNEEPDVRPERFDAAHFAVKMFDAETVSALLPDAEDSRIRMMRELLSGSPETKIYSTTEVELSPPYRYTALSAEDTDFSGIRLDEKPLTGGQSAAFSEETQSAFAALGRIRTDSVGDTAVICPSVYPLTEAAGQVVSHPGYDREALGRASDAVKQPVEYRQVSVPDLKHSQEVCRDVAPADAVIDVLIPAETAVAPDPKQPARVKKPDVSVALPSVADASQISFACQTVTAEYCVQVDEIPAVSDHTADAAAVTVEKYSVEVPEIPVLREGAFDCQQIADVNKIRIDDKIPSVSPVLTAACSTKPFETSVVICAIPTVGEETFTVAQVSVENRAAEIPSVRIAPIPEAAGAPAVSIRISVPDIPAQEGMVFGTHSAPVPAACAVPAIPPQSAVYCTAEPDAAVPEIAGPNVPGLQPITLTQTEFDGVQSIHTPQLQTAGHYEMKTATVSAVPFGIAIPDGTAPDIHDYFNMKKSSRFRILRLR